MDLTGFSISNHNSQETSLENQSCDSLEISLNDSIPTWIDDETQQMIVKDLWQENSLQSFATATASPKREHESSPHSAIASSFETATKDSMFSACYEGQSDETQSETNRTINTPDTDDTKKRNQFSQMTEVQLRDLTVKELNKLVSEIPKEEASKIRKRRRSLKNREYSQNSRVKELKKKQCLKSQIANLQNELLRVQAELNRTQNERDLYKNQLLKSATKGL